METGFMLAYGKVKFVSLLVLLEGFDTSHGMPVTSSNLLASLS